MSLTTTGTELDEAHRTATRLWARWLVMWNEDPTAAHDILGPGYRVHLTSPDAVYDVSAIRDATGMATWVAGFRGKFENLRYTTDFGPIVDGEYAVVRWYGSAVCAGRTGWQRDVAGEPIHFAGVDILRIRNGLIVEAWTQGSITDGPPAA